MYAIRVENCSEEELAEFEEELLAPLSARERAAEKNIGRWLKG